MPTKSSHVCVFLGSGGTRHWNWHGKCTSSGWNNSQLAAKPWHQFQPGEGRGQRSRYWLVSVYSKWFVTHSYSKSLLWVRCTPYPRNHSSRHTWKTTNRTICHSTWTTCGFRGKAYGHSPDVFEESWEKYKEPRPYIYNNDHHGVLWFDFLYMHARNRCLHRISIIWMDIYILYIYTYIRTLQVPGPHATMLVTDSHCRYFSNTANHH